MTEAIKGKGIYTTLTDVTESVEYSMLLAVTKY